MLNIMKKDETEHFRSRKVSGFGLGLSIGVIMIILLLILAVVLFTYLGKKPNDVATAATGSPQNPVFPPRTGGFKKTLVKKLFRQ